MEEDNKITTFNQLNNWEGEEKKEKKAGIPNGNVQMQIPLKHE